MIFQMKTTGVLGGFTALAFASSALAAVDTTDPFVGTNVTYSDVIEQTADPIDDPLPLYGPPVLLSGDLLDFDPVAFPFASSSPPADTTDGALSFTVTSNDASSIPVLIISEGGDYSFLGLAADAAAVSAGLFVQILDTATQAVIVSGSDVFSDTNSNTPTDGGFWSNEVVIDLSPYELTEFDVLINNTLQAAGPADTSASIRKKNFQVDVPEPGTVALLAGGLALMTLRRKTA
ncbi:MAG: PEP-CTERM sorting domain-containing protein [Planctomycetota bacterium]